MEDIFGKVVVIILATLMLFLAPTMLIATKMDQIFQDHLEDAVVEFVDNARTSGKITDTAYEQMCKKIDDIGVVCDVKITHSAQFSAPTGTLDADGYYETESYRYDFQKDEILAVIYTPAGDNEVYELKNGDYLSVKVESVTPTLANRLSFLRRSGNRLFVSYGGYVGNNIQ